MSEIVRFKAEHLLPLLDQPINQELKSWFDSGLVYHLEQTESVTVMYQGNAIVCGGITKYWPGRGQLWAVFNEETRKNFLPAFRAIKHWIHSQLDNGYNRIEMSVDYEFKIGHRRAKRLGFTLECELARKYLPTGQDCSLYSLVRD